MLQLPHQAERPHLLVLRQVLGEAHRRGGDAALLEALHPLRDRVLAHHALDLRLPLLEAPLVLRVRRVVIGAVAVVVDAKHGARGGAQRRREAADGDRAVLRLVGAVVEARRTRLGDAMAVADRHLIAVGPAIGARLRDLGEHGGARHGVADGFVHHVVVEQRERGAQHRGLDQLPLAGALAVVERARDRHRRGQPRRVVDDRRAGVLRGALVVGAADHGHQPGVGGHRAVRRRLERSRALAAVGADLAVDEAGVEGGEQLVTHAEAFRDAGPHVVHQHVEARDEALDQRLAALVLEVDGDRALAAVERLEALALAGYDGADVAVVLALARLDLDHVGAEVGEVDAAVRPCGDLRELEHAHAVEGTGRHRRSSVCRSAGVRSVVARQPTGAAPREVGVGYRRAAPTAVRGAIGRRGEITRAVAAPLHRLSCRTAAQVRRSH